MWTKDLQIALNEIDFAYGNTCCIESIENNVITMTNFDRWKILSGGHIVKI